MKTFEEICPKWNKLLLTDQLTGYIDEQYLSITSPNTCIVGEAHGFRDGGTQSYKCSNGLSCGVCYDFAMHRIIDALRTMHQQVVLQQFVEHFNAEHLNAPEVET